VSGEIVVFSLYRSAAVVLMVGLLTMLFWRSLPPGLPADHKRRLVRLVILAFAVKLAIVMVWYQTEGGLYIDPSVSDQGEYLRGGTYIAAQIGDGELLPSMPAEMSNASPGYHYVVGVVLAAFGDDPFMVSATNVVLSVALSCLIYHVALSFADQRVATIALLLSLAYPQYVSASYFVLKDIAATFLVVVVMWGLCAGKGTKRMLVVALAVMVMAYFRFGQALVVGGLALGQLMLGTFAGSGRARRVAFLAATTAALAGSLASASIGGYDVGTIGFTTNVSAYHTSDPGFLEGERLHLSLSSLGSIAMAVLTRPVTFAAYAAETVFHTFWGPPYLYSRSGPNLHPYAPGEPPYRVLLESASGLFLAGLMPLVATGWLKSLKTTRRHTFFLWAFPVVWTMVLVFTGTVIRWRLPMIPCVLLLASLGWTSRARLRAVYPLYAIGFAVVVAVNASLGDSAVVGKAVATASAALLWALVLKQTALGRWFSHTWTR
jgi:hypothetical protein